MPTESFYSATFKHLVRPTVHPSTRPPMKDTPLSIWLLLLSLLTPALLAGEEETGRLLPPLPGFFAQKLPPFVSLRLLAIFSCRPSSSSLFLELPLAVRTTPSFFWRLRPRQQYEAGQGLILSSIGYPLFGSTHIHTNWEPETSAHMSLSSQRLSW